MWHRSFNGVVPDFQQVFLLALWREKKKSIEQHAAPAIDTIKSDTVLQSEPLPVRKRRNELKQVWVDDVPSITSLNSLDEAMAVSNLETEIDVDNNDEDEIEIVEELSPLQRFFAELGDTVEATIHVTRLPDPPAMRGRWRVPCIEAEECGSFPFNPQEPESYIEQTRENFGGGRYKFTLKERGRYCKQWMKNVSDSKNAPPTEQLKQPSQLDNLEQQLQLVERINRIASRNEPRQTSEDQFEKFVSMFDKFSLINERLNPPRDAETPIQPQAGLVGQLASLLDTFGRHAPRLLPLLVASQSEQSDVSTVTTRGDKVTVAVSDDNNPFAPVVKLLIDDLTANNAVEPTRDAILDLVRSNPEHGAQLSALLSQPNTNLIAMLARLTNSGYLLKLPNRFNWLEELKESLKETSEDVEDKQTDDAKAA